LLGENGGTVNEVRRTLYEFRNLPDQYSYLTDACFKQRIRYCLTRLERGGIVSKEGKPSRYSLHEMIDHA